MPYSKESYESPKLTTIMLACAGNLLLDQSPQAPNPGGIESIGYENWTIIP